MKRALFKFGI